MPLFPVYPLRLARDAQKPPPSQVFTEVRTTIVTTNLFPSQSGKIFDSVTASAILDRLSTNGRFIICEGRSFRSKK